MMMGIIHKQNMNKYTLKNITFNSLFNNYIILDEYVMRYDNKYKKLKKEINENYNDKINIIKYYVKTFYKYLIIGNASEINNNHKIQKQNKKTYINYLLTSVMSSIVVCFPFSYPYKGRKNILKEIYKFVNLLEIQNDKCKLNTNNIQISENGFIIININPILENYQYDNNKYLNKNLNVLTRSTINLLL